MFRGVFASFLILSIIVIINAQLKRGSCPPAVNLGVCAYTCMQDYQCPGEAKCCRTACGGSICVRPATPPPPTGKLGNCPAAPTGPWVCSSRCSKDSDCRGTHKCCKNRCGAMACMKPE